MQDSIPPHQGAPYQACLRALHEGLKPRSYLEIGTPDGETTGLASCATIVVDPQFRMPADQIGNKPACHFFQTSSDAFFAANDPRKLFGRPVDMAYLDGTHISEYLLRDFICTERVCHENAVILLHDCIPLDLHMAVRDQNDTATRARSVAPTWWTGDVWKTVHALHRHRPDLRIQGFRAPPTGLIMVSRLSPDSTTLAASYRRIVDEMHALGSWADYQSYLDWLRPADTNELVNAALALVGQQAAVPSPA
jgi:hypothetical protein